MQDFLLYLNKYFYELSETLNLSMPQTATVLEFHYLYRVVEIIVKDVFQKQLGTLTTESSLQLSKKMKLLKPAKSPTFLV